MLTTPRLTAALDVLAEFEDARRRAIRSAGDDLAAHLAAMSTFPDGWREAHAEAESALSAAVAELVRTAIGPTGLVRASAARAMESAQIGLGLDVVALELRRVPLHGRA